MPGKLKQVTVARIGDCAEVLPGYSLKARAEHEPDGTHQIIMAKHLTEGAAYRYRDEHELRMTPTGNVDKYVVNAGDVLFVSRGTKNHSVVVESVPANTLASSTLYVLKIKPGIDPAYVAWYLNQAAAQAAISQVRTGAGTPIVQRSVFTEMAIPLPELSLQHQIVRLGDLMARERQIRIQLSNETERYHRLLGQELLKTIENRGKDHG